MKVKDLTGQRFDRLTVSHRAPSTSNKARWTCVCTCGKQADINGDSLRRGLTRSCGCLLSEVTSKRNFKHGLFDTPEHRAWRHMHRRCTDKNDVRYPEYGGRGITVCQQWSDFLVFLRDVGQNPTVEHTIHRKENDGNYEPSNCEWADRKTQQRNRQDNRILTANGESKTVAQWSEEQGKPYGSVWARVQRGWSHYDAIFTPLRARA